MNFRLSTKLFLTRAKEIGFKLRVEASLGRGVGPNVVVRFSLGVFNSYGRFQSFPFLFAFTRFSFK